MFFLSMNKGDPFGSVLFSDVLFLSLDSRVIAFPLGTSKTSFLDCSLLPFAIPLSLFLSRRELECVLGTHQE